MTLYFTNPLVLLLLLGLIPLVVVTARRLVGVSGFRKVLIMVARSLLFGVLVVALAGLKIAHKSDDLSVFFLLDISKSIPRQKIRDTLTWINSVTEDMKQNDHAGLIVFGGEQSIEKNLTETLEVRDLQSRINDENTNISAALRLALAAFPEHTQKKIVLISDGNENVGEALDSAYMARSNKVPVYVKPIAIRAHVDTRIDKMEAPHQSVRKAPFDLKIFLASQEDTNAKLRVFKDDSLILDKTVRVEANKKNLFSARVQLEQAGFHTFKSIIEAPNDAIVDNNTAYAFTYVKDVPRILFVEGNPVNLGVLPALLSKEKVKVDMIEPGTMPDTIRSLVVYDCILLSNVSIDMLSFKQMEMIERAVHDFGIGLVVIGGDKAYGPGGYQDTPLETALPVSMDIRQKKVLPNGALVVILHTCEIPRGNTWAREVTLAALRVLSARDYFGVLYYGGMGGEQWLFKPTMCGNKSVMVNMIRQCVPQDMPSFDITLEMAYKELKDLDTYVKHIVIISDGDPASPNPELAKKIVNEKITISTVVINPHSPRDADVMQALAKMGNGNFYFPQNFNELPKIFTKEAMMIRKSAIIEREFIPTYAAYSDILGGFSQGEFPPLLGYVSTTPKDTATVPLTAIGDDPLLGTWRYGLGKSVAFASDATTRWAQSWLKWDKFDKFWSQVIRWAIRETTGGNYVISTDQEGDTTRIVLDALDNSGYYINYLQPHVNMVSPDLETESFNLTQISPGKYAADIATAEPGNYMMSLNVGDRETPQVVMSGLSVSYSPEFNDTETNDVLLEKIADASNGAMVTEETPLFEHDPPTVWEPRDVWQYLAAAAVILLLLDIFVRRVIFGWEDVRDAAYATAGALKQVGAKLRIKRKKIVVPSTTSTLLKSREEFHESRKLKEQATSEVLKKIREVEPEPEDVAATEQKAAPHEEKPTPPEKKAKKPPPSTGEEQTYIKRLLDAKKKRKE